MIRRLFINGIGTSVIQFILYVALMYTGSFISRLMAGTHYGDWTILIIYSIILFPSIVLVVNITSALINKKIVTMIFLTLAFLFYIIAWGEDFSRHPYVTTYAIVTGAVCLGSKIPIDRRLGIVFENG